MSMTDLLVIIVAVLFVLVLLDGLRRKWSGRDRVVLKLDKSMQAADVNEEEFTRSELPNGGARTKLRPGDEIPRPPKPAPKLKVVEQVQRRREQALSQNVPVLLDAVDVAEERIEHTNVFADSSAVPAAELETRGAGRSAEEESMGIYLDELDAELDRDAALEVNLEDEFADLTADLGADRSPIASNGGDDDEDEWEEEWVDDEEDEEDDEEEEDEFWEEPWDDDDEEEDEDEEDDDYDDFEDEDDEFDDDDDDDDDVDEDEDEDEDEEETFPDFDEEQETWNRQSADSSQQAAAATVLAAASHARQQAQTATIEARERVRSDDDGRVEPGFGSELEAWEEVAAVSLNEAAKEQFEPAPELVQPAGTARVVRQERQSRFGKALLGKKDQGELFADEPSADDPATAAVPETTQPQEVIVINVMARPGEVLDGSELLPLLQKQGLRLGDMSIFHKHAGNNPRSTVLFSMANMVKPGTFDLSAMDGFVTPGVSFFLQLPSKHGNMACFDQMLAAATAIRDGLDGELKDENRSVMTRQTLEHYKQRIRDFELKLLSSRR